MRDGHDVYYAVACGGEGAIACALSSFTGPAAAETFRARRLVMASELSVYWRLHAVEVLDADDEVRARLPLQGAAELSALTQVGGPEVELDVRVGQRVRVTVENRDACRHAFSLLFVGSVPDGQTWR